VPVPPTIVTPGNSVGPPVLTEIPPPGGGGGGGFSPPVTLATPEVPAPPVTPVPEPASWALMLLGFALIGRMLKRRGAARPEPARE
jgi:hypothetical protein